MDCTPGDVAHICAPLLSTQLIGDGVKMAGKVSILHNHPPMALVAVEKLSPSFRIIIWGWGRLMT
jgi:hypothetical protein